MSINPKKISRRTRTILTAALCLGMLGVMAMEMSARPTAEDAAPYHQRVAEKVEQIPYHIDDWVGQDEPPPPEAIELLRPNAMFSRRYEHIDTGERVSVVIVQTRDARDLAGHYPPICYPAHGWTQEQARPADFQAGGMALPGIRYQFQRGRRGEQINMTVDNFLITPTGQVVRDMQAVRRLAGDYSRRMFGAAQVQVVYYNDVSEDRREQIFQTLVGATVEAIQAIQAGGVSDGQ